MARSFFSNTTATTLFTCLALAIFASKITSITSIPLEQLLSLTTCTPDCLPGYECINGECKEKDCTRDCSLEPQSPVCGSNGITYSSRCALERAECEIKQNIDVDKNGTCVTVAPPPITDCRKKQIEFESMTLDQYNDRCNSMEFRERKKNNNLTLQDATGCFQPHCRTNTNKYEAKQCSFSEPMLCWCVNPDGDPFPETLQYDMPAHYCAIFTQPKDCNVDGQWYKNGDSWENRDRCGLCECKAKEVVCHTDFEPDSNNNLTDAQLENFKGFLIEMYAIQHNYLMANQAIPKIDIRHSKNYSLEVSDSLKTQILRWKFNVFDSNDDRRISSMERISFATEIFAFSVCNKISQYVVNEIDTDDDGFMSADEWEAFFCAEPEAETTTDPPPSKRDTSSVISRKPLHLRKKFKYVLV